MADQQLRLTDPDQYLFAFEGDAAVFVDMDRDAYHRSIFLDRRLSPRSAVIWKADCATLYPQLERAPARGPGFIFHMAHCGSTLLARALDLPDANLVYREPMALRQLGVAAGGDFFGTSEPEAWRQRLLLAWTLLGRRYRADGPVIVKANVPVNFMLPSLMALDPEQPAILLHHSLENYLLAILRSPAHCDWVRNISRTLQRGIDAVVGSATPDSSLAVSAARLWLAQALLFADTLARFPNTASLDAEDLFNRPGPVLAAAFSHYGQPQDAEVVDAIVRGELFTRYSKNPDLEFNNEIRLERQAALMKELEAELDEAHAWIAGSPASRVLDSGLASPLVRKGTTPAKTA